jgi:hypothetical protein
MTSSQVFQNSFSEISFSAEEPRRSLAKIPVFRENAVARRTNRQANLWKKLNPF